MKESHICSCVRGEAHESAKGYMGISFNWIVGVYSCTYGDHMYVYYGSSTMAGVISLYVWICRWAHLEIRE